MKWTWPTLHELTWLEIRGDDPPIWLFIRWFFFLFLGTGIFGAFFLLLLIVVDLIPQATTAIPRCGIYISCNMLLVVFSLLFNTLITSIHNIGDDKPMWRCVKPVSTFVQCAIILDYSARDSIILKDTSPFCGATDTPVFDFWWCLLLVSKPEWAALFQLGIGVCIACYKDLPLV